ncbi:NADP-dependent 3-hydroxy acid dehydrogenase YdfG [Saccharothrix tamanrassetensis]|uniref:NADP-dependent 3-hydroxy acid dehydrogenase YdfG n=1 Tax=Saccharothrix tamanrassetensis TaxID=1051531 RepID=A0A841CGE7_9PSEU|nr:SDR family oxidoreductase [Saccharothrix tamanrassetensis]MBB5956070.1 NADP-dependent 3-hydroxy acid dehydrogenase YdfG [Saccharothrix tamanrassetensis]
MTYDLTNRTAVVTGAASGIGAEIALVLARSGARVALLARRTERLTALADRIVAEGGQGFAVTADVTKDLSDAVRAVHDTYGRVDLVVNNAGVMLANPIAAGRTDEWSRMIDTNISGVLNVIDAFSGDLIEAAGSGPSDLVNISSVGAHLTFPNFAVYTATKAAVTHLSANLRAELGPLDVRVTNVEPGFTESELAEHIGNAAIRDAVDGWFDGVGRLTSAEVADVVGYATSRAKHVNLRQIMVLPTRQV